MTNQRTRLRLRARGLSLALAVVTATSLAACAGGGGSVVKPTDSAGPDDGSCGTVPQLGANDPDGLLKGLGDIAKQYNGFPNPILKSAWADWKPDHAGPYKAAIVTSPLENPFQTNMHDGVVKKLKENGVEIVADLSAATRQDVPGQLQQLRQVVAMKPDIIFLYPLAPEPAIEEVEAAGKAGIPVVSMQNSTNSEYAVSLSLNNVLQAMTLGSKVFEAIDGKGKALRVHGVPGVSQDKESSLGYEKVMELCPGIEQVGEVSGTYSNSVAQQEVLKFLATHPAGVDAVLSSGTMGLGILQAFKQSGKDPAIMADPGSSKGAVAYAHDHPDYPYFGTGTPSLHMGEIMGEVGLRILAGQGPKINQFAVMPQVITQENIDKVYEPSYKETDPEDAPGDPNAYFPKEHLDKLFNKPELSFK